jgi:hypothetical protein
LGIIIHLVSLPNWRRIVPMLAIRITGNQLRAGRALADLSMEDLAARARRPRQGQRGALRCASKVIANGA